MNAWDRFLWGLLRVWRRPPWFVGAFVGGVLSAFGGFCVGVWLGGSGSSWSLSLPWMLPLGGVIAVALEGGFVRGRRGGRG